MDKELNKGYSRSKEYQSEEFPSRYNKFIVENAATQNAFTVECLQKIYHSSRLSGTRLLDFGCGPSVHKIAAASRQFNDIVLSEWSEPNRVEVKKWLRGDKDALDWTSPLEQCARAEGYRDLDTGVAEIEGRIRKAVKKVVPCDALSKDILPDGIGEFDAINSSFCLETCCVTIEMYKEAFRKMTKYLKKGGIMVMSTILEAEIYNVHKTLPVLYLMEKNIKEALTEANLELRDCFCWRDSGKYELFKYGGVSVCYSVKL